jgi:Fe-S cluster biogenesis protein NfuA
MIPAPRPRSPLEQRVDRALERIRPAIVADGGDVWLVRVDGDVAYVQLIGACGGCAAAHLTLKGGIETVVREDVPEIREVRAL